MNLILLKRSELGDADVVTLSDARAAHIRGVLRAGPGESVRIGLVDGPLGIGTVETVHADQVSLRCSFELEAPARPRVDLLLALPRPKVMRRLWAQLAAIGVGQIILTNAEKVERHYFDTHVLEPEAYRPFLLEGLQQARDTRVPVVGIHRQFRKLVEDDLDGLIPDAARLVATPGGHRPIGAALTETRSARCVIAIGPEGGWNAFELELLASHHFQTVSLGPRTLRTDTACVALLSLAHAALQ